MPHLFRRAALLLCVAGPAVAPLAAQQPSAAEQYAQAVDHWWYGRYPQALEGMIALLSSPAGRGYSDSVALFTGELYRTRTVTEDAVANTGARWSAGGRYVTYAVGTGRARTTRVVDVSATPRQVAELRTATVAFAPGDAQAVYLGVRSTAEIERVRRDLAQLEGRQPQDRAAISTLTAELAGLEQQQTMLLLRDMATGRERALDRAGVSQLATPVFSADGRTIFAIGSTAATPGRRDVVAIDVANGASRVVVGSDSAKAELSLVPGGRFLLFTATPPASAGAAAGRGAGAGAAATGGGGRAGGGGTAAAPRSIGIHDLQTGQTSYVTGTAPSAAAGGSALTFLNREGADYVISVLALPVTAAPVVVRRATVPLAAPAISPSGATVAFQIQQEYDWEIHAVARDGSSERRVTREIQHDLQPRFLDETRIVSVMGESRHRRSHIHDVNTGARIRLFDNNTVRTIAPEYEWQVSPDATRLLVVAERDGDTVSPERGVYIMDLTARVSTDDVLARLRANLATETELRQRGARMFAPIADQVRARVADASVGRVYGYQKALFDFDSKNITRPGNAKAVDYLMQQYRAFGYEPVRQEFTAQGQRTANVVATLRGTVNPELVYVVGSHFDSHASGPGADDNTSGTAALLEAARVLARHPLPATVVFVSFTAEESGLLGSREFARVAAQEGWKVVGALNNDMLGWTNDGRLDNTIRYSNPGIRDVQHAASFLFTDMVTYDAVYYKSTDAQALYDAWGDIIGGIGSYPVLGNPHYHMPHDNLEFENHQLITEAGKSIVATMMLMASSPSRIGGLAVAPQGSGAVEVTWTPSPEKGIVRYLVTQTPPGSRVGGAATTTAEPRVRLTGVAPGTVISVKAVNEKGLEGWDWARVTVGR
jgi:hypothetical protein